MGKGWDGEEGGWPWVRGRRGMMARGWNTAGGVEGGLRARARGGVLRRGPGRGPREEEGGGGQGRGACPMRGTGGKGFGKGVGKGCLMALDGA